MPTSKTLEDFTSREFAADDYVYSSFAYLIGAIRGISLAIARTVSDLADESSTECLESVDVVADG